jgi:hypothetical protein
MTDQELIARIRDSALLRGQFTLRSGRTSTYYLDKYLFETQPDILAALGQRFAALGYSPRDIKRMLRSFNGYLEPFKQASDHYERLEKQG